MAGERAPPLGAPLVPTMLGDGYPQSHLSSEKLRDLVVGLRTAVFTVFVLQLRKVPPEQWKMKNGAEVDDVSVSMLGQGDVVDPACRLHNWCLHPMSP